jgi:predicted LPLAT superfamily acyltransferase
MGVGMNTQAAYWTAKIVGGIVGGILLFILALQWSTEWTLAAVVMGCLAVAIYCLYKVVCLELEIREFEARREINRESRQKELTRRTQAYVNQINKGMK